MAGSLTGETTELLQTLIRNSCVNDGTPDSGGESRNSDLLETFLEGPGSPSSTSSPGRGDVPWSPASRAPTPTAPTLCLMGHTDVVPVSPDGWHEDPFGGELIDGEVWGRGAIDMLNLTASQAVAFRHLARNGFRPRGTLIYFGVADEEAGGVVGREVDDRAPLGRRRLRLRAHRDGRLAPRRGPQGRHLDRREGPGLAPPARCGARPATGRCRSGPTTRSMKAAEVVARLAAYRPAARLDEMWAARLEASGLPEPVRQGLLDPERLLDTLAALPQSTAKLLHACTHTTISPNVAHGGIKTNVIPDTVTLDVDIRTLPGVTGADVDGYLREALGDLAEAVEVSPVFDDEASASPTRTPLWDILTERTRAVFPEAELLGELIVGATDSRFFRAKGAVAYGTGLFSPDVTFEQFASRFHGHDERIDVASLGVCTDYWLGVVTDLIG